MPHEGGSEERDGDTNGTKLEAWRYHGGGDGHGKGKMRILLMCYIYPPEVAPAGQMTAELAEYLAARGHEVTVLTAFPNHPEGTLFEGWRMRWRQWEEGKGFEVLRSWHVTAGIRDQGLGNRNGTEDGDGRGTADGTKLALGGTTATADGNGGEGGEGGRQWRRMAFYASFAGSSLLNGTRLPKPDVILGITTPIVGGLLGLALGRLRRAKYIHVVWDVHPEGAIELGIVRPGFWASLMKWIDTFVCRHADKVAVLSQGLKRILLKRNLPDEQIEILPIWIDADEIQPLPRLNDWRREQGIGEDAFVVLYAGTIGLISGAEFVLEAAAQLQETDPEVLILFVGAGQVRDRIAARAREEGLRNIRMLPFQDRERLAEVQATADVSMVTLLPGQGKTSVPSKVLGYMSAARPVIASVDADSDTAGWIVDSGCGIVTEPQDAEGLAEAIRRLKDDEEERRRMGEAGRRFLLERYSKDVVLGQYEEAFGRRRGRTSIRRASG